MAADDSVICDLCKKGQLSGSLEELKVQQWSDKGYVHFRTTIPIRICDFCGAKSFGPAAEQILDEAFRREYNKLP
jgi:hypothetical protein